MKRSISVSQIIKSCNLFEFCLFQLTNNIVKGVRQMLFGETSNVDVLKNECHISCVFLVKDLF